MLSTTSRPVAALGACVGGALLAASGAMQATGLDWTENAVKTPAQHVTMALFAAAFVLLGPAARELGRLGSGRLAHGWIGIAVGQAGVAAASTVSNIRGVDASWFPAVAIAANALWVIGTFALAIALFRARRLSRLMAAGLVVAYLGSVPLGAIGGGIVAGAYWLALAYLLGAAATQRPAALQPSTL